MPLHNTGVKQTPNKSKHTQLTLEKKILPSLLPVFELTIFWSWTGCSDEQASAPSPPPHLSNQPEEDCYLTYPTTGIDFASGRRLGPVPEETLEVWRFRSLHHPCHFGVRRVLFLLQEPDSVPHRFLLFFGRSFLANPNPFSSQTIVNDEGILQEKKS